MRSLATKDVYALIARVGLVLALALVVATFQDYGVTWDEFYHNANGKHVLAYYATLFADREVLTYHNLFLYGGVFDGVTALFNLVSPFGAYETAHLLTALVGLSGVIACWKLTKFLAGSRAALIAAMFLLVTPSWYGHMFFNPKDIPFAAAMAWSLYYVARVTHAWPATPARLWLKLGVMVGLTLGIRVGGVIAVIYLAVAMLAYFVVRASSALGAAVALREVARLTLRSLLPAGALAYAVMLLSWPWAQQDPIGNPIKALLLFSYIAWDINVLFDGQLVNSLHLPASYLPVYFAVKLPELVLILLMVAVPVGVSAIVRRRRDIFDSKFPGFAALISAVAFPFLYFAIMRPVVFDGIRHFLFVLPPIAAVAGITADRLLAIAAQRRQALAGALVGVFGLGLAWQAYKMVDLHPDEYVYYNLLVGGVKGAEGKFELDYWGNSYAEAVDLLVEQLEREREMGAPAIKYKVAVCSSGISASYFFPPELEWTGNELEADFYISTTRLDCDDSLEGDPFIKVERDGATLSVVKDRRALRLFQPERLRALGTDDVRIHPGLKTTVTLTATHQH